MDFFNRRRQQAAQRVTAPSGDIPARIAALNTNAVNAETPADALATMNDAAGITSDLFKSFEVMAQNPAMAQALAGLNAQELGIPEELLKSFQALAKKPDAKSEPDAKPEDAPDDEGKDKPEGDKPEAAAPLADEPLEDSPEDKELLGDNPAPAAAPEAITAATGQDPDNEPADKPADKPAKLAKSFAEIVAEAQAIAGSDPANAGSDILIQADTLLLPLIKSFAENQQHQAQTSATLETTNEYLEQIGMILTKSLEGQMAIANEQRLINERLDQLATEQTQGIQNMQEQTEAFQKSFAPALEFINGKRYAPQATPTGSASFASHQVQPVALSDVAPQVQEQEETHFGFTRGELKKSIEAHLRSDASKDSGITTAHYLSINRVPLAELDRGIYEVAAKATGRALPANA